MQFNGFTPAYIDSLGDVYYFIKDDTVYLSKKGTYWTAVEFGERISSIGRVGSSLLINHKTKVTIPNLTDAPAIFAEGGYYGSDSTPAMLDGTLYLPLRHMAKLLDADLLWNNNTNSAFVTKGDVTAEYTEAEGRYIGGSLYIPVRTAAEKLGMVVEYNSEKDLVVIK